MEVNSKLDYKIVDTISGLEDFAGSLEKEKTIAVDLEADSMFHFQEKVCLIQIASEKINAIIDPLKINDLSSLKSLFVDRDIKKIFHGADYDVRSLYRDFRIKINNLFDTQLASMFLGINGTGLDAVVRQRFNIKLDKRFQKKDWSKRPLPDEMIQYAAGDAIYLFPLAKILEKELAEKERLPWVQEECAILSKVRPPELNNNPLYLKFKGAGRLTRRCLAVLESLLQFRRKIAKKKDRPLFKIFSNASMMKIAIKQPANLKQIERMKVLSARQIDMHGNALVKTTNRALEIPEKDLPVYLRGKAPLIKPEVKERAKALKNWRDKRAKILEIDPALLLNKALMNTIAVQNPLDTHDLKEIKEMKNWQKNEFGKDITAVLRKVK
ncbi:MAG: HRDC domain-containing protein [Deltaproteobacteria bacterium]|nr:HRDC domain-containing protein [Deltaproteobacteria bacterium]MBW2661360.1 HRDC domain-containing protein [Deltaproteobacteria bacterium]